MSLARSKQSVRSDGRFVALRTRPQLSDVRQRYMKRRLARVSSVCYFRNRSMVKFYFEIVGFEIGCSSPVSAVRSTNGWKNCRKSALICG